MAFRLRPEAREPVYGPHNMWQIRNAQFLPGTGFLSADGQWLRSFPYGRVLLLRIRMKTLLNSKKQVFGDQGGMKTLDNEIVVLPWPVCSKNSILQFWRSLPVIPAKFPDIDRIIQYIVNGGIGKYRGFPGMVSAGTVQFTDNFGNSEGFFAVKRKNQTDSRRFVIRAECKTFPVGKTNTVISVRGNIPDVFSLFDTGEPSGLHPPVDCFILSAGHEETEFKILQIKIIFRFVDFVRGYNPRAAVLKSPCYDPLIDRGASCQTFNFHNQDTFPLSLLYLGRQLVQYVGGGDRRRRSHLPGAFRGGESHGGGKGCQNGLRPGTCARRLETLHCRIRPRVSEGPALRQDKH